LSLDRLVVGRLRVVGVVDLGLHLRHELERVGVVWIVDVLNEHVLIQAVQALVFDEVFRLEEVEAFRLHLVQEKFLLLIPKFILRHGVGVVHILAQRVLLR
jgi:hypothetical protein